MEKNWMKSLRGSDDYMEGVVNFLNFAFKNAQGNDKILCPCKNCNNCMLLNRQTVHEHLILIGFNPSYTEWVCHGEQNSVPEDPVRPPTINDEIETLFRDTFPHIHGVEGDIDGEFWIDEDEYNHGHENSDNEKIKRLMDDGTQPLYEGSEVTKLSFIIRLFTMKCVNGWSNESFNQLLKLMIWAFPKSAKIPTTYEETRGIVRLLGLKYRKIDACIKDCMLFWKDHAEADECHVCGESRWVNSEVGNNVCKKMRRPRKTLRHFPLIPRLKRLYMCSKIATDMRWHCDGRKNDEKIRHPADAVAWKHLDSLYPEFANETRNVRLGLSSDGFNPFRSMSIKYSMWPVVLIAYNLPPWFCMKPPYLMLSLLIPGEKSPGNDIDVFLEPLVDELKELWDHGVWTFDSAMGQTFLMRAVLLWTINDFPAYAMLSGYSTKGKLACPYCHFGTYNQYLNNSRKTVYLGHRRFLCRDHQWRFDRRSFNGQRELEDAPKPLSGSEILNHLRDFENDFGKRLNKAEHYPFKKRSIFFELSYWEHNLLRHNLDVMHIEKNIVDAILGTLLNIPKKSKDHLNARHDLKELGIRQELHPIAKGNNKFLLPPACYSMGKKEKDMFCKVLKYAKFPDGYASNISRCIDMKDHKISGHKTHDCHFILHYLLPLAVRKTLPKHVTKALIRLSSFFRAICAKVLDLDELDRLQVEIIETICQLEMIFPPSFFDIMIHLPIHLVNEVKLGGPVTYRWMYSPERYLLDLKNLVRNRGRPEGSIAEGYIAKEASTFCSRYLGDDAVTIFNRRHRNPTIDDVSEQQSSMFPYYGYPLGATKVFSLDQSTWTTAHRYVLFNTPEISVYTREHSNLIRDEPTRGRGSKRARSIIHSREFHQWFADKILNENVSEDLKWLARGPSYAAKRYKGFFINGYRFRTEDRDKDKKTQNCGVVVVAATEQFVAGSIDRNPIVEDITYYGVVEDIIELDYHHHFKVVLFQCKWFRSSKDEFELPVVDFDRLIYKDDPFVFATQVKQVFYVQDPYISNMYNVLRSIPRETYEMQDVRDEGGVETYWIGENTPVIHGGDSNYGQIVSWCRDDVDGTTVDETHIEDDVIEEDNEFDMD